jgi:protoporphyrinogen oxidase
MKDLLVIGGGITGLTVAYLATKAGLKTTVLEAGSEFGGLLRTFPVGPTRLEYYYHHFFTHDAEIHWLLRELNLEDHLYYRSTTMGIFRGGNVYPFTTPMDLLRFRPLPWGDKLRLGGSSLYLSKWADWRRSEEVSAWSWIRRYAGKRALDSVWGPLLEIKFGPYAKEVPLSWLIGRLRQRMGSRQGSGDERLGYLRGSLQILLDRLLERLRQMGATLVADAPVRSLRMSGDRVSGVRTDGGEYGAAKVISTVPTVHLAKLVKPVEPEYAKSLERIEYFGAVCMVLHLKESLSPVYWLNVAEPGFPFGGVIEQTRLLGPENYEGRHISYLSRYFAHSEPIAKWSIERIREEMLRALPRIFARFDERSLIDLDIFRTDYAAPVCDLGFSSRVPRFASPLDGLYVASMPHVYPDERSVNNSIRVAANAIRELCGAEAPVVSTNASLSGQIGF